MPRKKLIESPPPPPKSLDELAAEATTESTVESDQKDIEFEPEKKRKRRRRQDVEMEQHFDTPISVVSASCKAIFTIAAVIRKCPVWRLSDDEANELAVQLKPAWDSYVAPYAGKYGALVAALTALVSVAVDKAQKEKEWKKETESRSLSAEREPVSQPLPK